MKSFKDILNEKVVIFDGATGTHIQSQNLNADDFGGETYNGCNEYLVLTKPSAVQKIHVEYLTAGCDVIETNTFGGTPIVLAEYGLAARAHELNFKAAQLAKKIAIDFSTTAHRRFVAGSMGPTTKLPSLGHISFKELAQQYFIQAKGLIEGGVDLLMVETCQDILQTKAALVGIHEFFEASGRNIPIVVSVTIETTGTMLVGTEVAAALVTVEPFEIEVFGVNCATGPKEMSDHIRALCSMSPKPIIVMPNAGMPENIGGHAHYHLTPNEFAESLSHFVKDLGVNVVGGCCGTTPAHIRKLVEVVGNCAPRPREFEFVPSVSSLYQAVPMHVEPAPVMVGERTNANGSKLFRDLLVKEDWEGIVAMGKEQVREQAHLVDVCVAYVGRNEVPDMQQVVSRFNTQITAPIVIDSTEAPAIETALQLIGGKPIINSINLEDGEQRIKTILSLCKKYGAAVIALTIDERGMAKTTATKIEIVRRIYDIAVKKYGMNPCDLIFDTLTFTLGSGDEEYRHAAAESIEAIKTIKLEFPLVHTILGVSNVSFGLNPKARNALNSVFLHYAVEAGLDMAIVHASKIMPLFKIDDTAIQLSKELIFDERKYEGIGNNRRVVYDPLKEFMAIFSAAGKEIQSRTPSENQSVEGTLHQRILDGDKSGLEHDMEAALKEYTPFDIINTILLKGMKHVGELFGAGQMQLPFVLQSAEVMKAAVTYLEPFMEKKESTRLGTMVIATVKGDVHDIGKNLVDIILTNNGYHVINLGIKCPIDTILKAANEHGADAIGMSGLLVKSTLIMKENLEVMNERAISVPVVLGGAALTRRYVDGELKKIYGGRVDYANDAFDGLKFMESLSKKSPAYEDTSEVLVPEEPALKGTEAKIALFEQRLKDESVRHPSVEHANSSKQKLTAVDAPQPPFWGSRIVEDIDLDELFKYVNDIALIRGQWKISRRKMSQEEYEKLLKEDVYPDYEALKCQCRHEQLLTPAVVYGYFPAQSVGNDLYVYPVEESFEKPIAQLKETDLGKPIVFSFPRQQGDPGRCISDFFRPKTSGMFDVVSFHLVTAGKRASEYAQSLFKANRYKDYLYFHGLSVETAEALAEYWHKCIRQELGIAQEDDPEIRKLFSQHYRGSRYSFGYPACPNLEDQKLLFDLLKPERIGITLSEEYQLDPEQSTSAIIVHHPEAKYFNVQ
jgi:5-methyltetrahydrofolate--homocysteine methyltransferase